LIDFSFLQPISWVAAAIGVCVAAFYYIVNLRETTRNRRVTLANNIAQNLYTDQGVRRWIDLATMTWKDNEDFIKKYDHRVNLDNYVNRASFWNTCEVLGFQFKAGLIDLESLDAICGIYVTSAWTKFKPLIEEYRSNGDYPPDRYRYWEDLAGKLSIYHDQHLDLKKWERAKLDFYETLPKSTQ
jgi:hypothetical protein